MNHKLPTVTVYDRNGEPCVIDPAQLAARLAAGYTEGTKRSDITAAQKADTELVPAIAPTISEPKRGPGRPPKPKPADG